MSEDWWQKLATHFRVAYGFPLPPVMRGQAERELKNLCPGTLEDAMDAVIADVSLSQSLVDTLGMGLTWFNRERQSIDALVEAYRKQIRAGGRTTFWIWSAGCSMGQEPYSVAMALLEAGAHPIILATDINREHLRLASVGRYRRSKLDMVSPQLL
jgi:chemotaxis protein methyltransferase CheR